MDNFTRPRNKADAPLTRADYIFCAVIAIVAIIVVLSVFAVRGGV